MLESKKCILPQYPESSIQKPELISAENLLAFLDLYEDAAIGTPFSTYKK